MNKQHEKKLTTLEIDRIFTDKDIADRHFVMKPCVECFKYSKQDVRYKDKPCIYCGGAMGINGRYWYSIRTWPGDRKLTVSERSTLGR